MFYEACAVICRSEVFDSWNSIIFIISLKDKNKIIEEEVRFYLHLFEMHTQSERERESFILHY